MHNSIPISEGVREGNCYQELEGEHYMEIMLMAIVALAALLLHCKADPRGHWLYRLDVAQTTPDSM